MDASSLPPHLDCLGGGRIMEMRVHDMALTDEEKTRIVETLDAYCERRVPIMVRDKLVLQYRIKRHDVVLFEKRPVFRQPDKWVEIGVAKFSLNRKAGTWSLFCADRNGKWHRYDPCPSSPLFENLLKEVDEDPTGIFWG